MFAMILRICLVAGLLIDGSVALISLVAPALLAPLFDIPVRDPIAVLIGGGEFAVVALVYALLLRDVDRFRPFLWLVALASLLSPWVSRAPLAQRLLAPMVSGSETVPRRTWLRLNMLWVGFYAALGALNLWVADNASERAWVNFKVFGLSAAVVVFAIAQALWLAARTETVAA